MHVSHVEKNMVEQSSTVPNTIYKEYLNHTLGLTLSTPGLVIYIDVDIDIAMCNFKVVVVCFNKFKCQISNECYRS